MTQVKAQYDPGDVIAERYRIERMLGRGGMGVVYLVTDVESGEMRALKTLLPQYAKDANAIRRFTREVVAVRKLKHPGIVQIHDARQMGRLLFYVMDYIDGKSLLELLRERTKLGVNSTVRILALLSDALAYAHQYTIHRDLSPDNVMVLADGSVKLLDFGLAKLADNQGAFTMMGDNLGKFQYRAPEQDTDPSGVDARADIYSLGVLFFAMLSGKLPELGDKLTEIEPRLPKICDAFAEKAMAMTPEKRFASAKEFRRGLGLVYKVYKGEQPDHVPEEWGLTPTPAAGPAPKGKGKSAAKPARQNVGKTIRQNTGIHAKTNPPDKSMASRPSFFARLWAKLTGKG